MLSMLNVAIGAAFALGLALLGVGLPDLLGHTAKIWMTTASGALLIIGTLLVSAR